MGGTAFRRGFPPKMQWLWASNHDSQESTGEKYKGNKRKKALKYQENYAIIPICDESNSLLAFCAGQRPEGGNKHEQV